MSLKEMARVPANVVANVVPVALAAMPHAAANLGLEALMARAVAVARRLLSAR